MRELKKFKMNKKNKFHKITKSGQGLNFKKLTCLNNEKFKHYKNPIFTQSSKVGIISIFTKVIKV